MTSGTTTDAGSAPAANARGATIASGERGSSTCGSTTGSEALGVDVSGQRDRTRDDGLVALDLGGRLPSLGR